MYQVQSLVVLCVFSALGCVLMSDATRPPSIIKGISYGPVPLKSSVGASEMHADDWFCDQAVPMWGQAGRGDLKIIKQMGANLIRLYGNSPDRDHTNFLDEAHREGLAVAPGMSDYPYYQMRPGSCLQETDYNCFTQVKPLYLQNLQNGFLTEERAYHPALKFMNILNEPDLKMPASATFGGEGIMQMSRAIISAFDAMLDAEAEAGVTGQLINFTATFSYAICNSCEFLPGRPALGQMAQLDDAMRNPAKYDYSPKHDITKAYLTRFTHSFNTQNPATDLQHQFLNDYTAYFPDTPVYIGEYHRRGANQTEDLNIIFDLAEANPLFLGISFFQYQVAYWKTGSEMEFGMFGLGDYVHATMPYFSDTYKVFCLVQEPSAEPGIPFSDAITRVYSGAGIDSNTLCIANPLGVPLDHVGFGEIAAQRSVSQMALFVERTLHHMGAEVSNGRSEDLTTFARRFADVSVASSGGFPQMASDLGSQPAWAIFDPNARCVSDRTAEPSAIADAIGWVCSQGTLNCSEVPSQCSGNPYKVGDYVFSRYYMGLGDSSNPLVSCSFQGAAIFAPSGLYRNWTGASQCSIVVTTTTTSSMTSSTSTTSSATTSTITSSTVTNTGFMSSAWGHSSLQLYVMTVVTFLLATVMDQR